MSYETFKEKVKNIARKAGISKINFSTNPLTGIHTAHADDCIITGNTSCLRISVRWGSGHTAFATI